MWSAFCSAISCWAETPTRGKLEITGSSTGSWTRGLGRVVTSTGLVPISAGSNGSVSLNAGSQIVAASFAAFSNEQIKRIGGRFDAGHDLATLLGKRKSI